MSGRIRSLVARLIPPGTRVRKFIDAVRIQSRVEGKPLLTRYSANHKALDLSDTQKLESALRESYFVGSPQGYLDTEQGKQDLLDHVTRRLNNSRTTIVPWLDAALRLAGARILEIGCGTGSDLVALGEQGARVTGIDIDSSSLSVASVRCKLYSIEADIHNVNATEVRERFRDAEFDFIIFYASLEHMIYRERIDAIRSTWQMLRPGALWCVIETPNRLWYTDQHTSLLPFFHWLPDDVAFDYTRFSPRRNFRERYRDLNNEQMLHFLRRGRGVSFHELEIALGSLEKVEVVSHLHEFLKTNSTKRTEESTLQDRYTDFLRQIVPDISAAFLQENLNIILRKK